MTGLQSVFERFVKVADRWRWLTWALVGVLALVNIVHSLANQTPWGQPWQESNVILLDFRDTIVAPGRFLTHGGNPYDPDTYLAAHPWAQEFDPYSPSWFLLAAPLSALPMNVGAGLYLVLAAAVLCWMAWSLVRLVRADLPRALAPLLACWFLVWYPTRVMGSSFICTAGLLLAMPAILGRRPRDSWVAALGLSIMLVKPQLGLWACFVLLAAGMWRLVARAVALLLATSLPALVACSISAGGFLKFLDSVLRDIKHASSPESPTGLVGAESHRSDLPGMYMRIAHADAPTWLLGLTVLAFLATLVWVWRAKLPRELMVLVLVAAVLVMPVHATYDIILAVVAAAVGWRRAVREGPSRMNLAMAVLPTIPVLHLHRITTGLGLGRNLLDLVDLACLVVAAVLAGLATRQLRHAPDGELRRLAQP